MNAGCTPVFSVMTISYNGFSKWMLQWTGGLNLSNFAFSTALQIELCYKKSLETLRKSRYIVHVLEMLGFLGNKLDI